MIITCSLCGFSTEVGALESCPSCASKFRKINDIFYSLGDEHYNYADLSNQEMSELIEDSKNQGWLRAVYNRFYEKNQFLYRIIADESRADWQYLISLSEGASILDVGAGWGTITTPLARSFKSVTAMDSSISRLTFAKIRMEQENLNNVDFLCADILNHPLAEKQYDLVVFNGVLEWAGESLTNEDPRTIQLKVLRNAQKLLKDDGCLYIGIENQYGFKYLVGEPDDHTGIQNITFLPRDEADSLMQARKGLGYRTYTYSIEGYKELLQQTGFASVEFVYPTPSYKNITAITPLASLEGISYYLESIQSEFPQHSPEQVVRNLERVAVWTNTIHEFVSSYGIIARKGEKREV